MGSNSHHAVVETVGKTVHHARLKDIIDRDTIVDHQSNGQAIDRNKEVMLSIRLDIAESTAFSVINPVTTSAKLFNVPNHKLVRRGIDACKLEVKFILIVEDQEGV